MKTIHHALLFAVALMLAVATAQAPLRVAQANEGYTSTGGVFVPVTPTRLLNAGTWTGGSGSMTAGETRSVQVLGTAGVPTSDVSAVVVDIAAHSTTTTGSSYLTVWPSGATRPVVSSMYYTNQNLPRSNTAVVKVGTDGKINLYNYAGTSGITVDIQGYFTGTSSESSSGGFMVMTTPKRIANTSGWEDGDGVANQQLAVGQVLDIQAEGLADIPSDATALFVNVEISGGTAAGTTWIGAGGSTQTWPSSMEYGTSGRYSSGRAVPLDALGRMRIKNLTGSPFDFKIDVQGYFTEVSGAGDSFVPVSPANIYSTSAAGEVDLAGKETRTINIAGKAGVPADGRASAVAMTVSVKNWTSGGTVGVFSGGIDWPGNSTVGFNVGQGVPSNGISSTTIVGVSYGQISIHNTSTQSVSLTLTAQGWFDRGPFDTTASNPLIGQIRELSPDSSADDVIASVDQFISDAMTEGSLTLSFDEAAAMMLDDIQQNITDVDVDHQHAQDVLAGDAVPDAPEVDPGADVFTGEASAESTPDTETISAQASSPGHSTEYIHLPAAKRYGDIAISPNKGTGGFPHGHAAIYTTYDKIVHAPGAPRKVEVVDRLSDKGRSFVPGVKLMSVYTDEGNGPLLSYEKRMKAVDWAKGRVGDQYRGVTSPNAFRVTASVGSKDGRQNCSQLVYGAYNYANGYKFNPVEVPWWVSPVANYQDKAYVWPREITDAPQTKVWKTVYTDATE